MGRWSRGGKGVLEKRPPGPPSAAPHNLSELRHRIRQKRAKNLSESGQFVPPKILVFFPALPNLGAESVLFEDVMSQIQG